MPVLAEMLSSRGWPREAGTDSGNRTWRGTAKDHWTGSRWDFSARRRKRTGHLRVATNRAGRRAGANANYHVNARFKGNGTAFFLGDRRKQQRRSHLASATGADAER